MTMSKMHFAISASLIGALVFGLIWASYNIQWGDWVCRKNAEYIEHLPTHILCVKDVRILDDEYNETSWKCSMRSDTNWISEVPACPGEVYCFADDYTMEECIFKLCDIRVEERVS